MNTIIRGVSYVICSVSVFLMSTCMYASLTDEISQYSDKLMQQVKTYTETNNIIETLYDIKSNFVGLTKKEEDVIVPPKYLKSSIDRAKQQGNEIFCLRTLFYNFKITGITKAAAKQRINEITDDVIEYRQGLYQNIMLEKTKVDLKNLVMLADALNTLKETTKSIDNNLKIEQRSSNYR